MFRVFGMAALNWLLSLNQPGYDGYNGYDKQDMYESSGTVADKINEPANNQNDGHNL